MPDLSYLVSRWWKQMLIIILLALASVAIILMLKPTRYLAVATAVPASTYATDKGSVFNSNMQNLYPSLGTPDDLDMVLGTAQLDTVYISVARDLDLGTHYQVSEKGEAAVFKAAHIARGKTKVLRSEFNNLKVKAWDADKNFAAVLANAVLDKLGSIHTNLQGRSNAGVISGLLAGRDRLQTGLDTLSLAIPTAGADARKAALVEQVRQYEKLISQYQLMIDNKSPALIVVEHARPASWPDKPAMLPVLAATLFLSTLFSLAVAVVLEKKRKI